MMRLRVLFLGLAMLATPARAADRNVVFFVADDHGTEALGAYGNRVAKTPEPGPARVGRRSLHARIRDDRELQREPLSPRVRESRGRPETRARPGGPQSQD